MEDLGASSTRLAELEDELACVRRREEELIKLIDGAGLGIERVSADGTILWANQGKLELLGYEKHEYVGHHIAEFYSENSAVAEILHGHPAKETVRHYEVRLRCKDGSICDGVVSSNATWDGDRLVHTHCLTRNITNQKRAEQQARGANEMLQALTDSSPLPIIVFTSDGNITLWNPAAERLFGWSAEEVLGKPIPFIPEEKLEEHRAMRAHDLQGLGFADHEVRRLRKDGRLIEIRVYTAPLRDAAGKPVAIISIYLDVTEQNRTLKALRESEQRFAMFMQHLPGAAWMKDLCGRYAYVNPVGEQIFHRSADELQGKTDDEIFPAEIARQFKENDRLALASESALRTVEVLPQNDGPHYSVVSKFPILDQNDKPILVGGIAIDITDRKKAEEEARQRLRELEHLYKTAPIGLSFMDTNLRYVRINERLAEINGAPVEAHVGRTLREIVPKIAEQIEPIYLHVIHSGIPVLEREIFGTTPAAPNQQRCWLVSYYPVKAPNGAVMGATAVVQDITERKRAEEELIRQTERLARSNADLRDFAYIASHDLQEPLRNMTAFTQLIAERYKSKLDAEADQYVSYVVDAAVRMTNLIQDLLSYSRLMNEESAPAADVSLNEAIARALDDLQTMIGESEAVVDVDALPSIQGNGKQWAQVFQNLISNAIKYRGVEPPHIRVSAEKGDTAYVFSVRDNGIGIDAAYHDKIFGVFKRLHGSDYPGTGIGLAICKKIVEKHGGRIWVESRAGEGSTFRFSVPAHKKAIWMGG